MPYSAAKIANHILGRSRSRGEGVNPQKLLKLVYIAHGWSFPFLAQPLLAEPAQAWQYGPVIPSLYRAISNFRAGSVTGSVPDTDPQELSEDARSLISSVYDAYARFSGIQLSSMTNKPNTPWSDIWRAHGQNAVIPNDQIAVHYKQLLETRENPSIRACCLKESHP